ncbi:efflux RND transporter periplasmic adaptor subunit [Caulobacter sp. KR2-114]|uniref:efflux RND transporter periplasmic adaptor subunit n=1 Tax=Caulobacter sp. KR2-114 TaxID=3400912 RepID=UPI003BFE1250
MALAACGAKPQGQGGGFGGPAEVGVVTVKAQPVALDVELSGRTSAFLVSDVRPQVSGIIQARLFTEGANVRKGQPLYQIDPATYRAALASAQAGLAQAQATLTSARLKADRYKDLVTINAVSRQDNDDAQAAWKQAAANVAAQQAAVEQARINLGYTRVLAPVSGRIGKSTVTPGALVTASQATALATVQDLSQIYVDVTQSAADLLRLRRQLAAGQLDASGNLDVTLTLDDGSTYPITGKLQFSDVTVDPGTGSVTLRAIFPNPNNTLLPGLYVRAHLAKGVAPAGLLVPQAAVSRNTKGEATLYVVGPNNKAVQKVVGVGQTVGDNWLVTAGLNPGERVIVEGLQKVHPGADLKPVPAGSPPAAPAAGAQGQH